MSSAFVLLDVDPSIVRPGWTALLVTVFIGAALVLLYFSLRRQVRRISPALPYSEEVDDPEADGAEPLPHAPAITGRKSTKKKT